MQYSYLELKLSWELYEKGPETLSEPEHRRLAEIAARQHMIERRILASTESSNVVIPPPTLATRLEEIRERYRSEDEFILDLERIGIGEVELAMAVEHDLRVEAVLEKIASETTPVSAIDAEIYYHLHPESFDRPETRRLRHILITFNDAREKAKGKAKLQALLPTLTSAEKFGEAALNHSQCPTALEGGKLGVIKRKQLYAELEPESFALFEGEISEILESPTGLHIVRCDEIFPSGMMPFGEVREKIITHLFEIRRKKMQRNWIISRLSCSAT